MHSIDAPRASKRAAWRCGFAALTLGTLAGSAYGANYSQVLTLPIPPASSFATNAGGDGWDVSLSTTEVFNVFHHDAQLRVSCHRQVDASPCWPVRTITDGTSDFQTSGHSGTHFDAATGRLFVYATRSVTLEGGVVCIDTSAAATVTNPFCGFTSLTGLGEAGTIGWSLLSAPMFVGGRLYAFNFVPGAAPGGPAGGGAQNRLLCFDVATGAACAGQPLAVNLGSSAPVGMRIPSPATSVVGSRLFIPFANDTARLACFDTSTQTDCAGTWPVLAAPNNGGPVIPMLTPAGAPSGVCQAVPFGQCFDLLGTPIAPPTNLNAVVTPTTEWQGPPLTLGPRIYVPNGNLNDQVQCYDYSTDASCAGYPRSFAGAGFIYTVSRDPQRPTCLWVNADNGQSQIQSFDAFSGGACGSGPIRLLASQFVVPQEQCLPLEYVALRVVAPARSDYLSGTVELLNGAGNPLGIAPLALDSDGNVGLAGLVLNTGSGLPQFAITLDGAPSTLGEVQVELTWRDDYDPACVGDSEVTLEATAVTTALSGGGQNAPTISVPPGTSVVDTAVISGLNAAGATGSVAYTWFSDSNCSAVVEAGSAQPIVVPGILPASAPVNLPPGTYFPVVAYSGDAGNLPAMSACGGEILRVRSPDSDGDGVVDSEDLCSGTGASDLAAGVPSNGLGTNRWADVNGDGLFDTTPPQGNGPQVSFSMADTRGCSCAQLIALCGYGNGFRMFGCTIGAMRNATDGGPNLCTAN